MRKSNNKIVVLLTGTVVPNISEVQFVKDPEDRKKQYIEAIKFYIIHTDFNIVFAENSGTSLAKYFQREPRVEFLTFFSPISFPDKGKSFKELEIIDYSFKNSKLISEADSVIKITGRLKILNINRLTKPLRKQRFYFNKIVVCNVYKKFKMDSRCFYFTSDFWPILKKNGEDLSLPYSFERVLWKSVCDYTKIYGGEFNQFVRTLRIRGVNGGYGTEYNHGTFYSLAKEIKHFFISWVFYKHFDN